MHEIISATAHRAQVERIERFQSLQPGRYWRAKCEVAEEGIKEGMVLLLQSLRYADDIPHTVVLRPHPSLIDRPVELRIPQDDGRVRIITRQLTEHRFLVKDFLDKFEFEPDHEQVRAAEVKSVQGRIAQLQAELLETQADPVRMAKLIESKLEAKAPKGGWDCDEAGALVEAAPSSVTLPVSTEADPGLITLARGSLAEAIGTGVTAELVGSLKATAEREHRIATAKSAWIKEKTAEIAGTLRALTPYFEEQAAAALAQTEDVRDYVDKLMQGIGSLDLYIGKGVEIETIAEGKSAPSDVPLTLVQRKLLMDEELALWADVDEEFDFSKESLFFEALRKHPGLIEQVFPTERCVLVMAITERAIDYHDPWVNVRKNAENRKVFLLARNGQNLYRIFSPVESHLGTAQLFPTETDQAEVFRGYDGRQIKFEDIAYTDKLSKHEKFALHYKRFLILICGLDHRLKLFGEFYPGPASLDFVSLDFQAKYLRFLFDGGARSLEKEMLPLNDWIHEKNAYLRSGSRVICRWSELMDEKTAPGACKVGYGSNGRYVNRNYLPDKDCGIVTARREGSDLCVEVKVSGYSYRTHADRAFNCKVNLSKFEENYNSSLAYLCLDAVSPEEINTYLHHRESRRNHIYYIRFFKRALHFLTAERATEAASREALWKALQAGGIASGEAALKIIDQAVIAWRASHAGAPLPDVSAEGSKVWNELLDQMYGIARGSRQVEDEALALAQALGCAPLKLTLSGSAKLVLYVAPTAKERDDRLEPHAWVHRITLERTKRGLKAKTTRWVQLAAKEAAETLLKEWPQAKEWTEHKSAFSSFEEKQRLLFATSTALEHLTPYARKMTPEAFARAFEAWKLVRDRGMAHSAYVHEPAFAIPIGMIRHHYKSRLRYLCVGTERPHVLLYRLAPSEKERAAVRAEVLRPYRNKSHAAELFELEILARASFELLMVGPSLERHAIEGFFSEDIECRQLAASVQPDPRLRSWYESWLKKKEDLDTVYLSEAVIDAAGALCLDEILGIRLPADYDPVVVQITKPMEKENPAPHLTCWFDIYRESIDPGDLGPATGGYGSQEFKAISPAVARKRIKDQAKTALLDGGRLVKAQELTDAPQPPQGVERWYIVRGAMA